MRGFFLFLLIFLGTFGSAKDIITTESDLDAAYIYLISKNTTWPNEKRLTTFKIAIVSKNKKIYNALKKMTKNLKLKSHPIKIDFLRLEQLQSSYEKYQVAFLDSSYKEYVENVYRSIPREFPLLLISDGVNDFEYIMINLYKDKFNKKKYIGKFAKYKYTPT